MLQDLKPFQIGRNRTINELSENIKIIMDANAVSAVEPTQIARVQRFLEQRRGRDGIIREDRFDFDVIKAIAPQCASHLPVIYPILPIATSTPPPNPP